MAESSLTLNKTIETNEPSDKQIVEAVRKDLRAFDLLYRRFVLQVFRYAYSRTGDTQVAEDITAQTFLAAIESFNQYRGDGHLVSWLFGITRNKLNDHFRQKIPTEDIEHFAATDSEADPLGSVIQRDLMAQISRFIQALTEDEQEILRLRFAAEVDFAEIARLLGRKTDAVKKMTYRLLARIKSQLEEENE
jgi:RNA polymerase sigma-70 factor (ECF subfamily)